MTTDYGQLSRDLTWLLGIAFIVLVVLVIVATMVGARLIMRSNERLASRYEHLRADTLREFTTLQREQNGRLIADTRATIAKMNAVADALWAGLSSTVSDVGPPRPDTARAFGELGRDDAD